ncbi:MAG: endonuclease III [Mogibacterium sp.]|nr:endonuclease III [Mogibacterium sp.]
MDRLLDEKSIPQVLEKLEIMHPEAACALDHRNKYELLISVVLSAQTTDVSVNKVTPALFAKYPEPGDLAEADREDVEDLIRTIGLYKNKSANIIKLAKQLVDRYEGTVPESFDDLVSLPGVGRKTANVVLAEGFGVPRIAVDTHVFRVANRIGITCGKDVTETEEQLMERIPKELWIRTHHLLIFHGRKCCSARKPACSRCLINDLCLFENKEIQ